MGSWVLGVQEATTTRLIPCSSIRSLICSWASWEQVNRVSPANTTFLSPAAYSVILGTSTTPEMLIPQLQTNTPTRGSCPVKSSSGGRSTVLVSVQRAGARLAAAAQAEAEAWVTEPGMSLGP